MKNVIAIVDGVSQIVVNDPWSRLTYNMPEVLPRFSIINVSEWVVRADILINSNTETGVMLAPDDDPGILAAWLDNLSLIALKFDDFKDGRAYSQAYLLRKRYGFKGELRALGDVLRDQLAHMRHCGFTSFVIREDKSAEDALKGLAGFDKIYASSVKDPVPLHKKRHLSAPA